MFTIYRNNLNFLCDMKTDIEIAHEAKMKPIAEIAGNLGIDPDDLILYGK